MISVKNVTKKYGEQLALKNMSFSINKGEIVGFLGPNGAGKSTMMKIINAYISADDGDVEVGGLNVSKESIKAKRIIGYLPEDNPLYSEMYVREYLEYVADIYSVAHSEIDIVIDKVHLSNEANKRIYQLSKGYKQRVGLAASIIHHPDYLVLDEPTTGLDPNQIVEIRNLIREFGKEKTVLLSTHIMQEVEAMCDRVIIINKGELVVDKYLSEFSKGHSDSCRVVFKNEIEVEALLKIDGVDIVKSKYGTQFDLKFNGEDILNKLLEIAMRKENSIIEFKVSDKSLEDIFRELVS